MLNHKFIGNPKSKSLLIFLHEGLGCIDMWRDYPEQLCEELNCQGLMYDRGGYGKSEGSLVDRKADYLHLAADELLDLITNLKLANKTLVLYGHSDGGSIALLFAAKYPKNVKTVITEAAHVFVEDITLQGIKPAKKAFLDGRLDGLKKYHGNRYKEVFNAWVDIWNHPSFRDWNIEKEIKNITCSQLIIQGKDDVYGSLKQVDSIGINTKGESTVFTPNNCGHAPFKEKRVEVLAEVITFLEPQIKEIK